MRRSVRLAEDFKKRIFRPLASGAVLFASLFFLCGMGDLRGSTEELLTLKEQGKDEAVKESELAQQERNFQAVRTAAASGRLREGMGGRQLADLYGKPAVASRKGRKQQWLYFARSKKWLDAPRVELYFDENNLLTGWECHYADCVSSPRRLGSIGE